MNVITENDVRKLLKNTALKEFIIPKDSIITPSAKGYLSDKKVAVINYADRKSSDESNKSVGIDEVVKQNLSENKSNLPEPKKYRYVSVLGETFENKPEHMTQVYGEKLVYKDAPIISFRGKLDSLQSLILETQISFVKLNRLDLVEKLEEVLAFIKNILRCEVLNIELENTKLLNLTFDEIRSHSHNPKKYYGIAHFEPSYKHGEIVVKLNSLRTFSRELELFGYNAFKNNHDAPSRPDILLALNRLSSLFYIMMFEVLKDELA